MSTPNNANAANASTSPTDRAVRTGPGRVVSANRAKIKLEDAARDAAERAHAEEEARTNRNASAPT